jgi:hypothetical protein
MAGSGGRRRVSAASPSTPKARRAAGDKAAINRSTNTVSLAEFRLKRLKARKFEIEGAICNLELALG